MSAEHLKHPPVSVSTRGNLEMSQLETVVSTIVENIRGRKFSNEASVREAIVVPILSALSWETLDPEIVRREFPIKSRRVDYGLVAVGNTPTILVEVKAMGQIAGGDRQLFEYAFHEGVPMAVLTDGKEWGFYLPGEHGRYEDRRVYKLDLLERDEGEACDILRRYLDFKRVKSGKAMEAARSDYKAASQKRQAQDAIPKAWQDLIDEPDELLIELLVEKTESICGFRPEVEQVEDFIVGKLAHSTVHSPKSTQPPTKPTPPLQAGDQKKALTRREPGSREISYSLFGVNRTARTAKAALIEILEEMSQRDPDFFEKLSRTAKGKRRNHLARTREGVYPQRQDLAQEHAIEISPGWWMGVNIANREKKRILEGACEVLGIRFGADLQIDLPNA